MNICHEEDGAGGRGTIADHDRPIGIKGCG